MAKGRSPDPVRIPVPLFGSYPEESEMQNEARLLAADRNGSRPLRINLDDVEQFLY